MTRISEFSLRDLVLGFVPGPRAIRPGWGPAGAGASAPVLPAQWVVVVATTLAALMMAACASNPDPVGPPASTPAQAPAPVEPAPTTGPAPRAPVTPSPSPAPVEPAPTTGPAPRAPVSPSPTPFVALRDVADFPVGVSLQAGRLHSQRFREVAGSVFSSITAGYEMKMRHVAPAPDFYRWHNVDALVEFAEANQMQVHGHTLVWHESTPDWLERFDGSDEEFETAVREYIAAIVGRYKGRVTSWDVVNEALAPRTGGLRDTVFRRRMGDDYVARLFQYARDADPDVLLFYNDFGTTWDPAKRDAMLAMVDDFQRRGIPIDGVGLQLHVTYSFPAIGQIKAVMDELVSRGLLVHVSELDVRVNPDGDQTELTRSRSVSQSLRFREIVEAFLALPPKNRFAITVWGLRDGDSWLIDRWGNPEWPLLFDDDLEPKPAYLGFLAGLGAS